MKLPHRETIMTRLQDNRPGNGWARRAARFGTSFLLGAAALGGPLNGCQAAASKGPDTGTVADRGDASEAAAGDSSMAPDTMHEGGDVTTDSRAGNASPDARATDGAAPDVVVAEDAAPGDAGPGDVAVDVDSSTGTTAAAVLAIMKQAADYQLAAGPGAGNADWVNKWPESVFYMGIMATYTATNDATYRTAATSWGTGNQWTLLDGTTNPPTRDADNQSAGQVYGEIYLLDPVAANAVEIKNTQANIDAMIAKPNPGSVDWSWCDALFMAPPLVARLGSITGQSKYASFLDTMWSSATAALYDPVRKLFWRDSTFVGTDTYWSRGNGWVMAGIARILEYLPATDPQWNTYAALLRTLAASVAPLQGADGLWRSDLLDPSRFPNPETSGTALFTYAMAWGIHHGILDGGTYLPIVAKGWAGLVANVTPQGELEYVQGTGSAPAAATADDSFDYGVGAFLLAGEWFHS
jgi:unsaturated rhamnogalacturonyl hydrolase